MEQLKQQLSMLSQLLPYKYIIDTCSILSQKKDDKHPRIVEKSLWMDIDEMISNKLIVTSQELFNEIEDEAIKSNLVKMGCVIIDVDDEVQYNVRNVVCKCPKLVDFKANKSSGDAFLIATAMKYDLIVISEENKDKPNKIPKVCECLGVRCVDILGLCMEEGWQY